MRGRTTRTTIPAKDGVRAGDLVNRKPTAEAPNRRSVADFTDVATWAGFVHVAFVIDVYSGMIVGWRPARSMRTDLVTDTLATTSPIRTPRPSRPRGDSSRSRCCVGSLNPPPDPTYP